MARSNKDSQLKEYLRDYIFPTYSPAVQETPELPSYTLQVKVRHRNNISLRNLEAHLQDMKIFNENRNIITVRGIPPRDGFDQDILAVVRQYDSTATIESSRRLN